MKKLHVTLKGLNTLLMNSPKTANPLHPLTIALKELTSIKNKTDEIHRQISELEWEAALYYDETRGLHIPAECIQRTLENGAVLFKAGKAVQRYVFMVTADVPLDIGVPFVFEKMKKDMNYYDVRSVVRNRKRVMHTRPRFDVWKCEFDMLYNEDGIDVGTIARAFDNAGRYIGLCDGRTLGYGRFAAVLKEVPMD